MPPSGIRRFFDMLNEMKDVISLTIGEPDFTTPEPITARRDRQPGGGRDALLGQRRHDRAARADRRQPRAHGYGVDYDPRTEIVVTVGASEGVDASLRATINAGRRGDLPRAVLRGLRAVHPAGRRRRRSAVRTTDATDFRVTAGHDRGGRSRRARRRSSSATRTTRPAPCSIGDELEAIARGRRGARPARVISDEIYERLVYGDHEHTAFSLAAGDARADGPARRLQQELRDDRLADRLGVPPRPG